MSPRPGAHRADPADPGRPEGAGPRTGSDTLGTSHSEATAAADTFPGAAARAEATPGAADSGPTGAPPPPVFVEEEETHGTVGTVVALLLMAALGIAVAVVAPSYGMSVDGQRVGPGFLPLVAGSGLAILAFALVVQELRKAAVARRERGGAPVEKVAADSEATVDDLGRTAARRQRNMRLVTVGLLVTILLIPVIGFLESFALLLLFVSIVVERRPVLPAVAITVAAVAVIYAIFVLFLNVRLPMGALAYLNLG